MLRKRLLGLWWVVVIAACGATSESGTSTRTVPPGELDSGAGETDGSTSGHQDSGLGRDGGTIADDDGSVSSGLDAGPDGSVHATPDAGRDAGVEDSGAAYDAGQDASVDTIRDAGPDAGRDAGEDAGIDAGPNAGRDAGTDAGADAGPRNRPPVITVGSQYTVEIGQSLAFVVRASDPDNDIVTVSAASPLPAGAGFDPTTRVFSYSPQAPGDAYVTFVASDGRLETRKTVRLTTPQPAPDTTPPSPPTFSGSTPSSPSLDPNPKLRGNAETGSTVRIYSNASCAGTPAATGTAAAFLSPGLGVSVAEGSTTTFYATATDAASNTSACSTSSLAYWRRAFQPVAPVAATYKHSCGVTSAGRVQCWGTNNYGQLGDGNTVDSSTAVEVGALLGASSVATGTYHSCALTTGGAVACWGAGWLGQLGNGSLAPSSSPVGVAGLSSDVRVLSSGAYHSCAITGSGDLWCWGQNTNGQLGTGTTQTASTPVAPSGIGERVISVGAGWDHTCVVTVSGSTKCWGNNTQGQLGDGTSSASRTPVQVGGLASGVATIGAGYRTTCALTAAGGAKCWGYNYGGQLGEGSYVARSTPVDVIGLASNVERLAVGYDHACANVAGGVLKCWGYNALGQLGDGSTASQSQPVTTKYLYGAPIGVAGGYDHTCASVAASGPDGGAGDRVDGGVECWGSNTQGEIGNGRLEIVPSAVAVSPLPAASSLGLGTNHTCASLATGGVRCWGTGGNGQIGDGTTLAAFSPTDVAGLGSSVGAVGGGGALHGCAITIAGAAMCWGYNGYGQLGDGSWNQRATPVQVVGLATGVTRIVEGDYFTCAIGNSGGAKCWGQNNVGQLGDGTLSARATPTDVFGVQATVLDVSAGDRHACLVTTAGAALCWGDNAYGQIGDGSTLVRLTPSQVSSLSAGVVAIAAGGTHSCALLATGAVKCWGRNSNGQVGDGTTARRTTPVDVSSLSSGVTRIAAGGSHSCAITGAGEARCWGYGYYGQIGDGLRSNRATPATVLGVSGAVEIAAGQSQTCAVVGNGAVKCWGFDRYGQVTGAFPGYPHRVIGF